MAWDNVFLLSNQESDERMVEVFTLEQMPQHEFDKWARQQETLDWDSARAGWIAGINWHLRSSNKSEDV